MNVVYDHTIHSQNFRQSPTIIKVKQDYPHLQTQNSQDHTIRINTTIESVSNQTINPLENEENESFSYDDGFWDTVDVDSLVTPSGSQTKSDTNSNISSPQASPFKHQHAFSQQKSDMINHGTIDDLQFWQDQVKQLQQQTDYLKQQNNNLQTQLDNQTVQYHNIQSILRDTQDKVKSIQEKSQQDHIRQQQVIDRLKQENQHLNDTLTLSTSTGNNNANRDHLEDSDNILNMIQSESQLSGIDSSKRLRIETLQRQLVDIFVELKHLNGLVTEES